MQWSRDRRALSSKAKTPLNTGRTQSRLALSHRVGLAALLLPCLPLIREERLHDVLVDPWSQGECDTNAQRHDQAGKVQEGERGTKDFRLVILVSKVRPLTSGVGVEETHA